MDTEYRGEVKDDVWLKPTCAHPSEPSSLGQRARRDFKEGCRTEKHSVDVAASDVIDEHWELGDPPIPDPDDNLAKS